MTAEVRNNESVAQEIRPSDKELNFRALESKYQKELEKERSARLEAEKVAQEALARRSQDEDDDSEPYVDNKKLEKKLAKFGENNSRQTQSQIQSAVQNALEEERRNNWLEQNGDFYDVLQNAEKLALKDPELAKTILKMPEGFERKKLVYANIKALGLHKPEVKQSSIQEKIDANRKSPYYQPSGVGSAPYASMSDFSEHGKKTAYDKMKELQKRLSI